MHICAQPQRTLYSFHTRSTDTHFPPRSMSNTAPDTAQSPGANEYSGFAFGIGIERIAMLKYGINNIKLLFESDMRVLKQIDD